MLFETRAVFRTFLLCILVLGLARVGVDTVAQEPSAGVVVEEVTSGFAAAKATLEVGDVLVSWHRAASLPANPEPSAGVFRSPFDVDLVELEEAPRGRLEISGKRQGEPFTRVLPPGEWRMTTRPVLEEGALARHLAARRDVESEEEGRRQQGLEAWRQLAIESGERGDADRGSWWWWKIGGVEADLGLVEAFEESFHFAIGEAERLSDPARLAQIKTALGVAFEEESRFGAAAKLYEEALDLRFRSSERSLAVAENLNGLGFIAWQRTELDAAEEYHNRALALREELAPHSLAVAESLHNLGAVARYRGDYSTAEAFDRRALAIRDGVAPQSLEVAASFNSLGLVAFYQGLSTVAEEYFRRALALRRELAPDSRLLAWSLANRGMVFLERGDLAAAESYLLQSSEMLEQQARAGLDTASNSNNLGVLALERGRYDDSERYFREALSIWGSSRPGSLHVAAILTNLGLLALERRDLASAARYLRDGLAIYEEVAPGSEGMAVLLNNLGGLAFAAGDSAEAEDYLHRSLGILQPVAPGGTQMASALEELGKVALERGELATAEDFFLRRWAILALRAPGSSSEAETLYMLGKVYSQRHDPALALDYFHRALDALESQSSRLGGNQDNRGSFLARYSPLYQDTVRLLVDLGRSSDGFHVLERSRARGLLALLAERDLVFQAGISPELERERRLARVGHDRILQELHELNDKSGKEEEQRLRTALQASSLRQDEIKTKIRLQAPRLAATLYPEPLDLAATQGLLAPGELLLSYSLGEDGGLLFAVGPGRDEFAVYELETGVDSLRPQVERFRGSLQPVSPTEQVRFLGAPLAEALLGPVTDKIARAKRLIVIPDGPLHYLPFAALPDPDSVEKRYLVESRPLSVVASATVLGELRQRRRARATPTLVAFGDPRYPGTLAAAQDGTEFRLRAAAERGLALTPLPHSRQEVESLGQLFPEAATLYLGQEASEARAKSLGDGAAIVHFATHGLIDEELPLESALALSIPEEWQEGEENGLLQVWEIYEYLRLDADLVTLSACETALGREMAGEGIVGLTRAFQFAGARTVLASLWAVPDQSTSELMQRFYRHLRAGQGKDEALRQAQLELIQGPIEVKQGKDIGKLHATHPFYWAAFQVIGDWQ